VQKKDSARASLVERGTASSPDLNEAAIPHESRSICDVACGSTLQALNLLFREGFHDLARGAQDHAVVWYCLALWNQGVRADQTVFADFHAVEDGGANADQRAVPDFATM
jgi:hypothetical protein